jgi:glycosyltransferase involved in cell wall biosynthesis
MLARTKHRALWANRSANLTHILSPSFAAMPDLRFLTALPVFNEANHVMPVLDAVVRHAADVLVVDDGSTDGTGELLDGRGDVYCVRHPQNLGYGAALKTAFDYAVSARYDVLVTIDCDGQHEPQRIQELVAACRDVDIVSGSRYLGQQVGQGDAPAERRQINHQITREVNERLGLSLTDTFCGFKAYRVASLARLTISEPGYGMPLELWVQAAHHALRIVEIPVPLIYLDEKRSFGGSLDDGRRRLEYYHQVIDCALAAVAGPVELRREPATLAGQDDACSSLRMPCCRDK